MKSRLIPLALASADGTEPIPRSRDPRLAGEPLDAHASWRGLYDPRTAEEDESSGENGDRLTHEPRGAGIRRLKGEGMKSLPNRRALPKASRRKILLFAIVLGALVAALISAFATGGSREAARGELG